LTGRAEISSDSSGILIRENILSSNMSAVRASQEAASPEWSAQRYIDDIHNNPLQHKYLSVFQHDLTKSKRSAPDTKVIEAAQCEHFVNDVERYTFYNPGYPNESYARNVVCERVISGMLFLTTSCAYCMMQLIITQHL
jgi:hypothetical protein